MHPHQTPTTALALSDAEMEQIRRYAEQLGITVDKAATELAKQAIATRYVMRKSPGQVVPFKRP